MRKTLIFDLGGVFVRLDPECSIRRLCTRFPGLDAAALRDFFEDSPAALDYELGRIDTETFRKHVNRDLGLDLGRGEFERMWNRIFDPVLPMIDLLPLLKSRYGLVLLSNTNPLHFQAIGERWPFYRHFDSVVLSYEVGCMKPDARIYRTALERSGASAEDCLFFDDREENVRAAEGVGIASYVFEAPDRVRRMGCDVAVSVFTILEVDDEGAGLR